MLCRGSSTAINAVTLKTRDLQASDTGFSLCGYVLAAVVHGQIKCIGFVLFYTKT